MTSLEEMVTHAEFVQERINRWPEKWRIRMADHERLLARTLSKCRLETMCWDCFAVMDTAVRPVKCCLCGSSNTASPYYC